MIKSFCIKTNQSEILDYLLTCFQQNRSENFYCSLNSFSIYDNAIFHYKGEHPELFYDFMANLLANTILKFYEQNLMQKLINYHYFYFSVSEREHILQICSEFSQDTSHSEFSKRMDILFLLCKEYIQENNTTVLEGFVNFRIQPYLTVLDHLVDSAVNSYIIEKEYVEFINLLKLYIHSKPSSGQTVHLIYCRQESLLLDERKKVITLDTNLSHAKYFSDISFSSNDYCLNTLLNLLPDTIWIHLIDLQEDEFIRTLLNIFGSRIQLCYDCTICQKYKKGLLSFEKQKKKIEI